MQVNIIGAHGSTAPGYQTSCYRINEGFLIDAGSVCSSLTPLQQFELTDIFITHPHLDHIKDICFIMENSFSPEREPLRLRSEKGILEDIHKHMFNDIIWPDFSKIYVDKEKTKSLLHFIPIENEVILDGVKVKSIEVNHPGNACGYLLDDGKNQIIFTGDTGSCRKIWQLANSLDRLKAIFTEITFPNRLRGLAQVSGHFTAESLLVDIDALENKNIPIYISHFKPLYLKELLKEFYELAPKNIRLLHQDDQINFD